MGATAEQGEGVHIDELPVHKVTVSDFYICRFEVTQEMYSYVMGKWENFSWKDLATTRCRWIIVFSLKCRHSVIN